MTDKNKRKEFPIFTSFDMEKANIFHILNQTVLIYWTCFIQLF